MVGRIAHATVFDQHAEGSARPGGAGSEAPASCRKHASGMTGGRDGRCPVCGRAKPNKKSTRIEICKPAEYGTCDTGEKRQNWQPIQQDGYPNDFPGLLARKVYYPLNIEKCL